MNTSDSADSAKVELGNLIELFFDDPSALGNFKETHPDSMPQPARELLAHDHHMTVTVEKHHGCPVDVKVLDHQQTGDHYSRKILLTRQSDGGVVQYGIVRLDVSVLSPHVRDEILKRETPLGRVLITNDVLREVRLLNLFEIQCGKELAEAFGKNVDDHVYGRTALIYCDGSPAIELLEIVS